MPDNLITTNLRKMAKNNHYQTLYSQAKEIKIRLFENDIDFSQLQVRFLNYLSFYAGLYMDFALGEVDERVFEDFIYEDSYNYYKHHNRDKNLTKEEAKPNDIDWVFKSKKK